MRMLETLLNPILPRVDIQAEVDWRELGSKDSGIPGLQLDLISPYGDIKKRRIFESPFGVVNRSEHSEKDDYPSLTYVHTGAAEGRSSCTLVQDSKYGFQSWLGGIKMRVLRSSFDPD